MDSQNYWYKLISYWVVHEKRTGLTIPFIIGARKYFEPTSEFDTVSTLMNKIKNSNIDKVIVLNHCPHVQEYVLGFDSNMYGTFIKNESYPNPTLKTASNTEILGNNYDKIITSLEERYRKCIENEEYSRSNGNWSHYTTDNDIPLINLIMKEI